MGCLHALIISEVMLRPNGNEKSRKTLAIWQLKTENFYVLYKVYFIHEIYFSLPFFSNLESMHPVFISTSSYFEV
jgi:hypothetical protein